MKALRKATPERLGAFFDGVFAVLITVLVLDLRPPEAPTFAALFALWPAWLSYAVPHRLSETRSVAGGAPKIQRVKALTRIADFLARPLPACKCRNRRIPCRRRTFATRTPTNGPS
jgi:hypothetical protein